MLFIYLSVDAWRIFDCIVICRQYRNSVAKNKFRPWPIEMRFCEDSVSQHKLIQMRCGGSASQHKPRYTSSFPQCSHSYFQYVFILSWPDLGKFGPKY